MLRSTFDHWAERHRTNPSFSRVRSERSESIGKGYTYLVRSEFDL